MALDAVIRGVSAGTGLEVKAGGVPPVTGDPAAVVVLSPNAPISLPVPTLHTLEAVATVNATSVKAGAGTVFALSLTNVSAATRYFKLYDKATAPTVGADIPILTIPIPAYYCLVQAFPLLGLRLGSGIAYAITCAMGNADATGLTLGDVKVVVSYL